MEFPQGAKGQNKHGEIRDEIKNDDDAHVANVVRVTFTVVRLWWGVVKPLIIDLPVVPRWKTLAHYICATTDKPGDGEDNVAPP